MKYLFYISFLYCCILNCIAQKYYTLYGIDFVDPNVKYLEIEYDTVLGEIAFFAPINDSFSYEYQIKPEYEDLIVIFPELTVDTTYFFITDTIFYQRTLLYKAQWKKEGNDLSIIPSYGYPDSLLHVQIKLPLKSSSKQSSWLFPANCKWGDCGFRNDWSLEWWVKTKYKGKKRIAILNNQRVHIFSYYYRSKLDRLKWYSTLYLDTKTLLPIGLEVQNAELKYDKEELYNEIHKLRCVFR